MSRQVFLKRTLSVLLFLACGAVFNAICSAGPLMVDKNLFANDRKPPPPDSADSSPKAAKPGMAIGNFQLDGVIIESNAKRAVLRMKTPPAGAAAKKGQPVSPFVTVREGQIVSDYRVTKIDSKSISLEKDGETFIIGLFAENKVSAPASPVPPPAPVQPPTPPPGVAAQQQAGGIQPGIQPQPGQNPQMAPQPIPGQPLPNRGFVGNRNGQQTTVYAPVPEPTVNQQEPNQPAETVEEEQ